jgi:hypothetical protein
MRDLEPLCVDDSILVNQNIDIDRTRRPRPRVVATEGAFDAFETRQECVRSKLRVALGDQIQERVVPVG